MDRNLGALDDRYHPAAEIKSKYYQFGRKDPFNSDIPCWTYDPDTFVPTQISNGGRFSISKSDLDDKQGQYKTEGKNMPFAVNNPRSFIKGDYWTGGAEAGVNGDQFYPIPESTKNRWQDPKANITVENEEVLNNTDNKSFFDPCPNGWSIPVKGWNGGFRGDFSESATGDITMNCQSNVEDDSNGRHRGSGRTYFPNGYLNERSNSNPQTCFFPYTGALMFNSGDARSIMGSGFMWSASNDGRKDGYYFLYLSDSHFHPSNIIFFYGGYRSFGMSVRCIKE